MLKKLKKKKKKKSKSLLSLSPFLFFFALSLSPLSSSQKATMASSPNSPHERDPVEEATARAEKRNEGGRHATPKGEFFFESVSAATPNDVKKTSQAQPRPRPTATHTRQNKTGYRSHPREQPAQRGQRVSAATEPSPRAEAALRAMGAAGPPMPPSAAGEEGGEEGPSSPASPPSSGTALAERASEGVAGSMLKPGEKFMDKK